MKELGKINAIKLIRNDLDMVDTRLEDAGLKECKQVMDVIYDSGHVICKKEAGDNHPLVSYKPTLAVSLGNIVRFNNRRLCRGWFTAIVTSVAVTSAQVTYFDPTTDSTRTLVITIDEVIDGRIELEFVADK